MVSTSTAERLSGRLSPREAVPALPQPAVGVGTLATSLTVCQSRGKKEVHWLLKLPCEAKLSALMTPSAVQTWGGPRRSHSDVPRGVRGETGAREVANDRERTMPSGCFLGALSHSSRSTKCPAGDDEHSATSWKGHHHVRQFP